MFKATDKLNKLNDKTPQKIIDATIKEITDIHIQQKNNIQEYMQWLDAWMPKYGSLAQR